VNTYDPADLIVYVHLARQTHPRPSTRGADRGCARLPAGYANESPSTALRQARPQLRRPAPTSPAQPSTPGPETSGQSSLRRAPERRRDAAGRLTTA
jgi:hypothetical protein